VGSEVPESRRAKAFTVRKHPRLQGNGGGQNTALLASRRITDNQSTDGSGAAVGYGPMNISDFYAHDLHILHTGGGLIVAGLNDAKVSTG
jgi:hypothetical protein